MTGRLATCRVVLRVWAPRGLTLALPLPLLALTAAAFALALALAPSSIGHRASDRPDLTLLPPTPAASVPAPATPARFAVTGVAVSGREHARSRPRRAAKRWRVEP